VQRTGCELLGLAVGLGAGWGDWAVLGEVITSEEGMKSNAG